MLGTRRKYLRPRHLLLLRRRHLRLPSRLIIVSREMKRVRWMLMRLIRPFGSSARVAPRMTSMTFAANTWAAILMRRFAISSRAIRPRATNNAHAIAGPGREPGTDA